MELKGKKVYYDVCSPYEDECVEFISLNGYPKFAFRFDEKRKKYIIRESRDTGVVTEAFVDEIIYSELPLETWTADYVVVRIGNAYYLADSEGNCYHKSDKPYIICRNLFVSEDKSFVINKKLEIVYFKEEEMRILESGGYKFAVINNKNLKKINFLSTLGVKNNWDIETDVYSTRNLEKWYFNGISDFYADSYRFFNKDFEHWYFLKIDKEFMAEKSRTYSDAYHQYYSTYFHAFVKFRKYGEIEVVEYDGNTYFFKPGGTIEKEKIAELIIQDVGEQIIYRIGEKLYGRDKKTGDKKSLKAKDDKISDDCLQWRDVYYFSLLENLIRELGEK